MPRSVGTSWTGCRSGSEPPTDRAARASSFWHWVRSPTSNDASESRSWPLAPPRHSGMTAPVCWPTIAASPVSPSTPSAWRSSAGRFQRRGGTGSPMACSGTATLRELPSTSAATCSRPTASSAGSMRCSTSPATRRARRSRCPGRAAPIATPKELIRSITSSPRPWAFTRRTLASGASRSRVTSVRSPMPPGDWCIQRGRSWTTYGRRATCYAVPSASRRESPVRSGREMRRLRSREAPLISAESFAMEVRPPGAESFRRGRRHGQR